MITTAPQAKPSAQTNFVLEAMEEAEQREQERWRKTQDSIDLLFTQVSAVSNSQQQVSAQMDLIAKAVNQSTKDQLMMAKQLQATGDAVSRLTRWQMQFESDMAGSPRSHTEEVNPFSPMDPNPSGARFDGGPRRNRHEQGRSEHTFMPKMLFPTFDGSDPRIWKDKCQEYFRLYNIAEDLKTSAASLHMEGNAAKWYQVFKLQNGLVSWSRFISAVESKFGAYDYRNALDSLLELK